MINVTAVSYLNTKPLLNGILNSSVANKINLQLDIPSECARKLSAGEAQLGLVPVAVLPELSTPRIISDYCIGTVGAVKTVCIYSELPLTQVKRIYLDHHSRTSVELTKVLIRDHWHLSPELVPASEGYIDKISGTTAGLIIGDRTIGLDKKFPYVYDLGSAWMDYTKLPFVFAVWVSTQPLPQPFIEEFNAALKSGVEAIPKLKFLLQSPHPDFDLEEYFTNYISYELDNSKRMALSRFLHTISEQLQASLEDSLSF